MAIRPYLMTGVALASAGAIVAAMPAADFGRDVEVRAASPAPVRTVTVEQIRLLQVTLQGIVDAFFEGYGVPEVEETEVEPNGPLGVLYYIGDETIFANTLIDNYFVEAGFDGAARFILEELGVPSPILDLGFDPVDTIILLAASVTPVFGPVIAAFAQDGGGFPAAAEIIVDAIIGALPLAAATATENQELLSEARVAQVEENTVEENTEETNPGLPRFGTGRLVDLATNTFDGPFGRAADPVDPVAQTAITETETEVIDETEVEESDEDGRSIVRNSLSFSPGGPGGIVPIEDESGAGAGGGWNPLRNLAKGVRDALNGGAQGADDEGDGDESGVE
jgi:hypothetical protein